VRSVRGQGIILNLKVGGRRLSVSGRTTIIIPRWTRCSSGFRAYYEKFKIEIGKTVILLVLSGTEIEIKFKFVRMFVQNEINIEVIAVRLIRIGQKTRFI